MTFYLPTRYDIRGAPCPACKVKVGETCVDEKGKTRKADHIQRGKAYRRTMRR